MIRRFFGRMRERGADRRALRAQRRMRARGDVGDAARKAEGEAWRHGGFFTR
jgi:hypothetical protein